MKYCDWEPSKDTWNWTGGRSLKKGVHCYRKCIGVKMLGKSNINSITMPNNLNLVEKLS